MKRLRIAVIVNRYEGAFLYDLFKSDSSIEVAGFTDISGESAGINSFMQNGVLICHTIEELFSIDGLEIIFETTGNPDVAQKLRDLKKPKIQVVEYTYFHLLRLLKNQNSTIEASLLSLIQSVNDGVQIVDKDGFILHVNNAFVDISGLSYPELIGQNIFEVMPECPTAKSLKKDKTLSGDKYYFKNSAREVSFHVTPLVNDDICCGSVAVYRELTDVERLVNELRRSRAIIEDIYERLAQSDIFPGTIDSDVIPIDHMEQALLKQALTKFGYSVEGKKLAAKALNISLATLYNKLKKYQIS